MSCGSFLLPKKEALHLKKKANVTVIVAAAGGGTRMGGISKPLMKIDGREALLYSLDLFCSFDEVASVVISVRSEDEKIFRDLVEKENYQKGLDILEKAGYEITLRELSKRLENK